MNQKERMLAGLPYKAWMDGLSEERMENKKRIYRFNHMPPEEWDRQDELLKQGATLVYMGGHSPAERIKEQHRQKAGCSVFA